MTAREASMRTADALEALAVMERPGPYYAPNRQKLMAALRELRCGFLPPIWEARRAELLGVVRATRGRHKKADAWRFRHILQETLTLHNFILNLI